MAGAEAQSESVWDYPRPPRIEPSGKLIRVMLDGALIAESTRSLRVLETSHPPTYYVPFADIERRALAPSAGRGSFCEWKGEAIHYDVLGCQGRRVERAAWGYPEPSGGYEQLIDTAAFYPAPALECTVEGELVRPQAGGFYGGWITHDVRGPFKGAPGTHGW